jgi:nucleoside-triphosphatase
MMESGIVSEDWQSPVYIISGEQGKGKTSFILEIISILVEKGIKIRGIAAPGYFKDDLRSGFSIINLATGIREELCSIAPSGECKKHGRYYFRSEGISFGRRTLADSLIPDQTDLLVIDEVGRFELEGEIWAGCIDHIVDKAYPPMIWTVRSSLVNAVIERWNITRNIIVDVGYVNQATFISDVLEQISDYHRYVK